MLRAALRALELTNRMKPESPPGVRHDREQEGES
jgi:hypothetical protein